MSSAPITPAAATLPPTCALPISAAVAPPSSKLSLATSTTGTGASGEIRDTFPQMK